MKLKGSDVEKCRGSMAETRNTDKTFTRGEIKEQFLQNSATNCRQLFILFIEQHRKQLRM